MNRPARLDDLSAQDRRALLTQLLSERAAGARSLPLSFGQQALWVVHRQTPTSRAYNIGLASRIRSPLDRAALRRALQVLVDRHAALRTTFETRGDLPVQIVHRARPVAFEEVACPALDEDAFREQVNAAVQAPFDLEHGPVFRTCLFEHGPNDAVLLLWLHHIVGDGWSCGLLLDELRTVYAAEVEGRRAVLPVLDQQYADYVEWESRSLDTPEGAQHRAYWHSQLAGALPVLNLPTDRPRPAVRRGRGATLSFTVGEDLTAGLRALALAERASLYAVLLGAFQVLLSRHSGQDDILVGSPMAGRSQPQFQHTVGYFVSEVVLRADLSTRPTFRAWLRQLRGMVHGAIAHQDYPFSALVRELQPQRDPSRSPIFDVVFNLLKLDRLGLRAVDRHAAPAEPRGLPLEIFPLRQEEGQFDLVLEMGEGDLDLFGELKYDTDLFDPPTIERFRGHFLTLLEGIVADPDRSISLLPILTAAERAQLLEQFNGKSST